MTHRNYHEIVARDPADCGRQLGRLFGSIVNGYVADASANPGWQRLKRNAAPLLEAAAGYFPDCIEELDAYAKTAGIPLIDLWTMSIEDELEEDDEYEKCTTIVTNGGRLIGHNEDWDEDSAEDICILKKTCGDITTLELYYYGSPLGGTAVSICSRGYIQAINSLHHSDMQVGVPKLILARRIAEIENAEVELPRILEIPRSSGFAHNLIDRTGKLTA
ncbi:MAG: carcinine hydrolase/isopenicillin-N N-acyltransferase family protein, partial [Hyphomicrobiaceae bacterium]